MFALASLVCGLSPWLWLIIIGRTLQGMGGATMVTLAMALVSESVPKEKTGSAMGLLGTMSAIGTALGPSIGGVLLAFSGWRTIFLFNLPFAVAAIFLVSRFLASEKPSQSKTSDDRFDLLGTLLIAGTLTAYAMAMTGQAQSWVWSFAFFFVAVAGTCLFVLVQSRAASPLIRLSVLRDRSFSVELLVILSVAMVATMTIVVGPFYLSEALHLNGALVGGVMSIAPITSAFIGMIAGRAVDRFGAMTMVKAGMLLVVLGFAIVAALSQFFQLAGFISGYILFGIGYTIFIVANTTSVMSGAASVERGAVAGTLQLFRYIGSITGAAMLGALFSRLSGLQNNAITAPHAIEAGMQLTFVVSAGIILASVVLYHLIHSGLRQRGSY